MSRRRPVVDWTATPEGVAKYLAARAEAQGLANADGFDRGLERNDVFRMFRVFMLPRKENRRGFELRCEVVSCDRLSACQTGLGPRVAT